MIKKFTPEQIKKWLEDNKIESLTLDTIDTADGADVIEVERVDFVSKKMGSVYKTDEGYIRGDAPIARTGIMTYYLPDGKVRRELVPAETLLNTDSLKTLQMKPITNNHPTKLVDVKNAKKLKVGFTGETHKTDTIDNETYLIHSITITDEDAIKDSDNGRQQFSPGYRCSLLMLGGTYNGEKYDAVQMKRVYNHLALCDKARGGSNLRLNFDENINGYELHEDSKTNKSTKRKEAGMPYKIKNIEYQADAEVVNHIDEMESKLATVKAELVEKKDELKAEVSKREANEALLKETQGKLDSIENSLPEKINAGIKERVGLINVATTVLKKEDCEKLDEASTIDIKKKVISAKFPKINLDEKDETFINTMYEGVVSNLDYDPDAINRQKQKSTKRSTGGENTDLSQVKKDAESKLEDAWKTLGK